MSAANTLRRAATVLREAAEQATEGPWEHEHRGLDVYETQTAHGDVVAEAGLSAADGRYIALVDPAVGLALADWLDLVADWIAEVGEPAPHRRFALDKAFAVARAILREGNES